MPESWDSSQIDLNGIVDRGRAVVEGLTGVVPLEVVLAVAVGATVMVGWWLTRKLAKLAFYYGIAGAAAWLWYFGVPD